MFAKVLRLLGTEGGREGREKGEFGNSVGIVKTVREWDGDLKEIPNWR